jgi:DNA-binding transcriptional ArsR family regulator
MVPMDQPSRNLMRVMAKPIRAQILSVLSQQPSTTNEVAAELGEDVAMVGYHMRVLEQCRLIELHEERTRGGMLERSYRWQR